MATEKTLKARFQQKIGTSADWAQATNFFPKKGEIIVYSDLKKIKIGDGNTLVGNLPFISDVDQTFNKQSELAQSGVAIENAIAGRKIIATGGEIFNDYENNVADGPHSHAEGFKTVAEGTYSHAEGDNTMAGGNEAHAEGGNTVAIGNYSHAEGQYTRSGGSRSHAEGFGLSSTQPNLADGVASHVEGYNNKARANYSHAEGANTEATGEGAHAEGAGTSDVPNKASGDRSHAEGRKTTASGPNSHAENYETEAIGDGSHAEGAQTKAYNKGCHSEGGKTVAGDDQLPVGENMFAHAEGLSTKASGLAAHAEGNQAYANVPKIRSFDTTDPGSGSGSGGSGTGEIDQPSFETDTLKNLAGICAHAEGNGTTAIGNGAHASGEWTIAIGSGCHAQGFKTIAGLRKVGGNEINTYPTSPINENATIECTNAATAEGMGSIAQGQASHAMGASSMARGDESLAGGVESLAQGQASLAFGYRVKTNQQIGNIALGRYNDVKNTHLFTIGNGIDDSHRNNAFSVNADGTATVGKNPVADMDVATKKYVDSKDALPPVTAADNGKSLKVVNGAWAVAEGGSAITSNTFTITSSEWMPVSSGKFQATKSISGVKADSIVISDSTTYRAYCIAQGDGTLTYELDDMKQDVPVKVVII